MWYSMRTRMPQCCWTGGEYAGGAAEAALARQGRYHPARPIGSESAESEQWYGD